MPLHIKILSSFQFFVMTRYPGQKGKIVYNVLAYRDVRSKKQFQLMRPDGSFTSDAEEAAKFVRSLTAGGGNDHPEDVAGALMRVCEMKPTNGVLNHSNLT